METKIIIETLGAIAKVENLLTIENNIIQNSFVLENVEPFPGYHGKNLPVDSRPQYLYLVTARKYSTERIIRISQRIRAAFKEEFDASAGKICINNDTLPCIRIRGIQKFEHVAELQNYYFEEGVKFARAKKLQGSGIIQVKKHFVLEKLNEHVYHDLEEPMMYYLKVPFQLKWSIFKNITLNIKNNVVNNNFDAALGAIYLREAIDVVRIFTQDFSLETLNELREKYIEEYKKIQAEYMAV